MKILSICITSYNRPKELERCLKSIDTKYKNDIEIIVSEDASPKREEIKSVAKEFEKNTEYSFYCNFNEINLGYDNNLAKLISLSNSKYTLFVSDDDAFNPKCLDTIIELLKEKDIPLLYTAYSSKDSKATNRRYVGDFKIDSGERSVRKYMYDSILFSGLIFKNDIVKKISAKKFVNLNYFQVYLFMYTIYYYGGYYKSIELIDCIEDGENGYGTTELSKKDPLLADRSSVFSNLQFNKGLIKVIKMFDKTAATNIFPYFEKEYSLRSYRGLSRARSMGRTTLKKYWEFMHNIGVKVKFPANIYYILLLILGNKVCDLLFDIPRKLIYKIRRQK